MDRNYYANKDCDWVRVSLSARRAWIEMAWVQEFPKLYQVALRKESVDRNHLFASSGVDFAGRSPQGERG